jgi:hypothetical protein
MIRTRVDVARFRLLPTVTVGSPVLLEGQEPGPTSANDAVLQSCSMREGQPGAIANAVYRTVLHAIPVRFRATTRLAFLEF